MVNGRELQGGEQGLDLDFCDCLPPGREGASADASPDDLLHLSRAHDVLVEAMNGLSADHRAVVDLTYFHGMGYREIAEIMECPIDTVKTRMFHARRKLKRVIPGDPGDWL